MLSSEVLQVVTDMVFPPWFDPLGMEAWVRGMADAFGCRLVLRDREGKELCSHGRGGERSRKMPLEINGRLSGFLEFSPPPEGKHFDAVQQGIVSFRALAEARNSIADLVDTNARQWSELTVLYRSSVLLRGGLDTSEIAKHLHGQLDEVLSGCEILLFFPGLEYEGAASGAAGEFAEIARWGLELKEGVLMGSQEEMERLGCPGLSHGGQLIVAPVSCGDRRFGTIVCAGKDLSSQHLKLACLLADQAGLAFANHRLLQEATRNERLRHELALAARIQESILPNVEYQQGGFQISSFCRPTAWVGGDTFILNPLGGGPILAGVADVSGHGISAALLINAFVSHLEALGRTISAPEELLAVINDLITSRVRDTGLFITVVLLRLDGNGSVSISSAGHPPVFVADTAGGIRKIDEGGIPLGILRDQAYGATRFTLGRGESILVFSDGLMEARNPAGRMYGLDRIRESFLRRQREDMNTRALLSGILRDVEKFCRGRDFGDDLTIQLIRRT